MSSSHLERLQSLLRTSRSASAPELKSLLAKLASEIERRSKSDASFDFFVAVMRALTRIQGTANSEVRIRCLFACQTFFFAVGRLHEALESAKVLRELATAAGDKKQLRLAETICGLIYADCGDIANAILHCEAALELASQNNDVTGEIATLCNLGSALNYSGLYSEAIPCFLRAQELCDPINSSHQALEPSTYCNLAQSYQYLGDKAAALSSIMKARSLSRPPETPHDIYNRTVREFTFVEVALDIGNREEAKNGVEVCRQFAQMHGGSRTTFLADVARGMYQAKYGRHDEGIEILQSALNSSISDVPTCKCLGLKVLTRAYDEAGMPEMALECLRELLAYTRKLRQEGIAALSEKVPGLLPTASMSEIIDLQLLAHKEADLRVQVAERHAARSHLEMFERLAISADLREEMTGAHGYRVGAIAAELASAAGYSKPDAFAIELAARLHDIGKVGVPDRILLSPSTLAQAERQFVAAHTTIGSELLSNSRIPAIRLAEVVARCHHEWWNGEGYPSRLAGKRIPIHARIVALADVFDALTHGRPFSPPWPVERALAEIRSRRGTQFDPDLTDIFLNLMDRLIAEHEDLDEYLGRASRHSPFLQARNKIRKMLEDERENEKTATVAGNQTRH